MHLTATLVPPPAELERVRVLVAGVSPVIDPSASPQAEGRHRAGSGWFGRRRGAGQRAPTGPMLDLLPTAAIHLPIAKFGNLALADAVRLADELERQAPGWPTPRLHLAGGVALEPTGDSTVRASLAGDLDALGAVIRGVSRVAQALQLFVDRRVFRPDIELGSVNGRTTTGYLEALLGELAGFEGNSWWQNSFTLVIPTDNAPGQPPFKSYRVITLGPAVAH